MKFRFCNEIVSVLSLPGHVESEGGCHYRSPGSQPGVCEPLQGPMDGFEAEKY